MNLLNCGFSVMMGALLSATAFAAGPAPAAKGEAPGAANEAKIKRILNDPDLYAGLGYADYEGADIGDARKKAVENASEDLSRHIRVRVESVTKDALSYSAKGKKHSEEESFDRVVKSFVDQVLNQSRDEEFTVRVLVEPATAAAAVATVWLTCVHWVEIFVPHSPTEDAETTAAVWVVLAEPA